MAPRIRKPKRIDTKKRPLEHNRSVYAAVQAAQAAEWRKLGQPVPWKEWVRTEAAKLVRENTYIEGNRLFDSGYGASTSGARRGPDRPDSERDEDFDRAAKRSRTESDKNVDPDGGVSSLPEPADSIQNSASMDVTMEAEPTLQDTVHESGRGSASGNRAAGGGGVVSLGTSSGDQSTGASFSKSRVWYSYAYANAEFALDDETKGLATPLAFIPVDLLSFYLSPAEWAQLPSNNVWVEEVTCSVKILGVRSGFDTGSTLSGTATSEYCPILHFAEGLNNKIHLVNKSFTIDTTKPMVPKTLEDLKLETYVNKWYKDTACGVTLVPRSNSCFAVPY